MQIRPANANATLRKQTEETEPRRLSIFAQTLRQERFASTEAGSWAGSLLLRWPTAQMPKCLMHHIRMFCFPCVCGAGFVQVVLCMLDLQPLRLDSLAAANTVLATLPLFVDGRALIPRAASRGEDRSQTMDMVI